MQSISVKIIAGIARRIDQLPQRSPSQPQKVRIDALNSRIIDKASSK